MTNFLKTLFISIFALACLLAVSQAHTAAFKLFGSACSGSAGNSPACVQANSNESGSKNRLTGTGNIIQGAANVVALITGVAAIIMIIISAITMTTSGGNQETVASSRRRLLAAVIGLAIVALAWTITRFITDRLIK